MDRQCSTDQEWTDGYWAFQNGQCAAAVQTQTSTQPVSVDDGQADNCCFLGWVCRTDLEWVNGFHAYRDNQCDAPAQLRTSGHIDNCCQAGWNCVTDREWENGRWAFQNNVCVHPSPDEARQDGAPNCCYLGWNCAFDFDWMMGRFQVADFGADTCGSPIQETVDGVIIEGSATFIARVKRALALIRRTSPEWYAYSITAGRKIRQTLASGTLQRSWNLTFGHTENIHWLAPVIVHESCHIQRWLHWVWHDYEAEYLAEEAVCDTVAINALKQIAPGAGYPRFRIGEFLSMGLDFDVDASAHIEWERAVHLLAQNN